MAPPLVTRKWTWYAHTALYADPAAWDEIGFPARPYPRGYKNIGVDAREPFEVRDARPAQEIRGQLLLAEPEATVSGRLGQTWDYPVRGPLEERAR